MSQKIVCAGDFMVSFVNNTPYACGGIDGGWIGPYPRPFAGGQVLDYLGAADGTLFVLAADNKIWACGIPGGQGQWVTIVAPPFNAVRLLATFSIYLLAEDDQKNVWVIGNIFSGGGWIRKDNLRWTIT